MAFSQSLNHLVVRLKVEIDDATGHCEALH